MGLKSGFLGSWVVFAISILCGITGFAPASQAAEASATPSKVLLVTSLDEYRMAGALPGWASFMKTYYLNYDHKLEDIFREFFKGRGFTVEVASYVDQSDLASFLHASDYAGIYIVSHEGPVGSPAAGMSGGGVFDYGGFDLTPVLSKIHPNLKTLALVGCLSMPLAKKLDSQFRVSGSNPNLELWAFDQLVNAPAALKKALALSLAHLSSPLAIRAACPLRHGYPIYFTRNCSVSSNKGKGRKLPAVRIEANGEVLATFPRCEEGERQTQYGMVRSGDEPITASHLKFVMTTGTNAYTSTPPELGELEISRIGQAPDERWKLFTKPDGTPFGSTDRVYRHQGSLPESWQAQDDHEFFGCGS